MLLELGREHAVLQDLKGTIKMEDRSKNLLKPVTGPHHVGPPPNPFREYIARQEASGNKKQADTVRGYLKPKRT